MIIIDHSGATAAPGISMRGSDADGRPGADGCSSHRSRPRVVGWGAVASQRLAISCPMEGQPTKPGFVGTRLHLHGSPPVTASMARLARFAAASCLPAGPETGQVFPHVPQIVIHCGRVHPAACGHELSSAPKRAKRSRCLATIGGAVVSPRRARNWHRFLFGAGPFRSRPGRHASLSPAAQAVSRATGALAAGQQLRRGVHGDDAGSGSGLGCQPLSARRVRWHRQLPRLEPAESGRVRHLLLPCLSPSR
jgi:hypothetical protein